MSYRVEMLFGLRPIEPRPAYLMLNICPEPVLVRHNTRGIPWPMIPPKHGPRCSYPAHLTGREVGEMLGRR